MGCANRKRRLKQDYICKDCHYCVEYSWTYDSKHVRFTGGHHCNYMIETGKKRGVYPAEKCYKHEGTPYISIEDFKSQQKEVKQKDVS